ESSVSFKSAAKATIRQAPARISPQTTSENSWLCASRSASWRTVLPGNNPAIRRQCAFITRRSQFRGVGSIGGAEMVDTRIPSCYFCVAQKFFCPQSICGGTKNRRHGVRCEEDLPHQRCR